LLLGVKTDFISALRVIKILWVPIVGIYMISCIAEVVWYSTLTRY